MSPSVNSDLIAQLVNLSVELHNLNLIAQRRFDLSLVQWIVLRRIVQRPGISAGSLAMDTQVHPSTLTSTLSRLAATDLVFLYERPRDQRRKLIVVSRKGYSVHKRVEKLLSSLLGRVPETLDSKNALSETRILVGSLIREAEQSR